MLRGFHQPDCRLVLVQTSLVLYLTLGVATLTKNLSLEGEERASFVQRWVDAKNLKECKGFSREIKSYCSTATSTRLDDWYLSLPEWGGQSYKHTRRHYSIYDRYTRRY